MTSMIDSFYEGEPDARYQQLHSSCPKTCRYGNNVAERGSCYVLKNHRIIRRNHCAKILFNFHTFPTLKQLARHTLLQKVEERIKQCNIVQIEVIHKTYFDAAAVQYNLIPPSIKGNLLSLIPPSINFLIVNAYDYKRQVTQLSFPPFPIGNVAQLLSYNKNVQGIVFPLDRLPQNTQNLQLLLLGDDWGSLLPGRDLVEPWARFWYVSIRPVADSRVPRFYQVNKRFTSAQVQKLQNHNLPKFYCTRKDFLQQVNDLTE
jgi:hypothetical protein